MIKTTPYKELKEDAPAEGRAASPDSVTVKVNASQEAHDGANIIQQIYKQPRLPPHVAVLPSL